MLSARFSQIFLSSALFVLPIFAQNVSIPKPPETPLHSVTDDYYGIQVTDDYQWLENWEDPAVKQWSAAENARTREYLDHLLARPAIVKRLRQLANTRTLTYSNLQFRAGMLFAKKHQPNLQQPVLVVMHSPDEPASARVVFDPNTASSKGSVAIDFFVPSFGGKYVAAAISKNGSEDAEARVFEVTTGKPLRDVVPRVNFATAGGSIAWKFDNSGFYYTRYPQGNERAPEDANFYQQIYFHKLGTPSRQDVYILGKNFPRIAEIQLHASDDGRWLLASVGNGDGGQFAHYLMDAQKHWTQLTHFEDGIVAVKFGVADGSLYLLSRKDAPRGQILRLPLSHLSLDEAKVLVPQTPGGPAEADRASIENFVPTSDRLYVIDIVGGPSRLRVFDKRGNALPAPVVPAVSAVSQVVSVGGEELLFYVSTFLEPPTLYRFDAATGTTTRSSTQSSAVRFEDAEVVRDFAISKDGTRVPLNIIRRKGTTLDGTHPALLTGYGGYSINTKPTFTGSFARLWLDQGGIFVETNLRGGAEYGEEWHQSGKLTRKQNVFDDFLACAQYLIDRNYTTPSRLAVLGGSNGGLLMGAAFTQRPELFRAVVSYVGIYDMLRVERDPNGAFNVTEFGTVKDPEEFKALYAYSPYHHVKDGTAYPAILMPTGENDHRVNPMQSRKMIARLQAADSSGRPILLRTSSSAGHGIGTSLDERIEQDADVFSFLFDQLGVQYTPPGP
jgi:prolyl oligopeptidase